MRPKVVFDLEIYPNFFFIAFKSLKTGRVVTLELRDGVKLDRLYLKDMLLNHCLIGFNSKNFDLPIAWMAVLGFSLKTLKQAANDIIVGDMKPWDIERKYDFKLPKNVDMIDLMEVAPGVAISLKVYGGRFHAKRTQDLPIEPETVLTHKQMDIVADYCENSDIPATEVLYEALQGQLDLRIKMGREYKEDLRSKSEAQVAEAVIKRRIAALTGEVPKKPIIPPGTTFKYKVPDYIRYHHPALREMLEDVRATTFTVQKNGRVVLPKSLEGRKIKIGQSKYRMGIGGLHSSEESVSVRAHAGLKIIDRDVASFYPNIIITLGLFPKHLGPIFLKVYKKILDERLAAKERVAAARNAKLTPAEKDVIAMESLKIVLNGLFGKLGSKYAVVYSPDLLIQVTLTGQLALLMKIDRIERAGFRVISANTDGLVTLVPTEREAEFNAIVKQWERDTGFETEATEYSALYSRDVNSYIAIKPDGKIKTKGAYANPWWEKQPDPRGKFMTSPKNFICVEAVVEFLLHGAPIEETVYGCKDVRKFITVQKVTGGALWLRDGSDPARDGELLGKTVRFYHSVAYSEPIYYAKPHATTGNYKKVAKSDGGVPCMILPDALPNDLDLDWYVREARELLKDAGWRQPPPSNVLSSYLATIC